MRIITQLFVLIIPILLFNCSCQKREESPKQISEFSPYILKKMDYYGVPGLAIGVVKGKELIYAQGFGHRNMEERLPVTPHTLFAIGSTTKAITALCLCQLVDKGELDLDTPITHYIPKFQLYHPYVSKNITPRDLLCHRSGLPRHDMMWYGASLSRQQIIQKLKYLEPSKGFRGQFQYQNMMYVAAGYLLEQITNQSWENYTRENILSPLEMNRTNLSVSISKQDTNYAIPYARVDSRIKPISFRNIDAVGPAGSINSTIVDMSHWVIMQLNEGKYQKKRIISPQMLNQTHTPQIVVPCTTDSLHLFATYGLGWNLTAYRGHLRISHGGSIDGFMAEVALYPNDSLAIIILCNMDHSQLPMLFRNILADHFLGLPAHDWEKQFRINQRRNINPHYVYRVTNTDPSHTLDSYIGNYNHPAYGTLHITIQKHQLHLKYHGFDTPLIHYHYDTFQAQNTVLSTKRFKFHTSEDGMVNKVSTLFQVGVDPIEFERINSHNSFQIEHTPGY